MAWLASGCGAPNLSDSSNPQSSSGGQDIGALSGAELLSPKDKTLAKFMPDPKMTPGDALDVTAQDICTAGYSKKVRNVPQAVKEEAYREYGITHREPHEYEVDHLISLELGGSNSIKNLWPQSFLTKPWNAHVKDAVEDRLHAMICSGTINIKSAQHEIASDWIRAYKKYVGPEPKESGGSSRSANVKGAITNEPAPGGSDDKVWVNTKSGAYWQPGTTYYGKTKQGEYISEPEAIKQGYHAAGQR